MAQQEPSIDQWLKEAKQDPQAAQCGMFLAHNGIVRITPKKLVRAMAGTGLALRRVTSYPAPGQRLLLRMDFARP